MRKLTLLIALGLALAISGAAEAYVVLGTGTGALLGGDLTDPENDGDDTEPNGAGIDFNAIFTASGEEGFSFAGGGPFHEAAFDLFDNQLGSGRMKWCCDGPPQWVTAEFELPVVLTHFTMASANDVPARDPTVWEIQGSNDGTTFTTIFRQDDPTSLWAERLQVIRFDGGGVDFAPPAAYKFLRYDVTQTGGGQHQMGEIEYFGLLGVPTFTWDGTATGDWDTAHWIGDDPPPPPDPNFPVDDGTVMIQAVIDTPGAVVNVAGSQSATSLEMPAGELTIAADSGLTLTGNFSAAGPVTLAANAQLIVGGGVIDSLTTSGDAVLSAGGNLVIDNYSAGGVAGTLTKQGAGTVTLDNVTAADTHLLISGGTLALLAAGQVDGQPVTLSGGTLSVADSMLPGAAPDGAVAGWTFDDVTDATVANEGSGGASMNGTMMGGVAVVPGMVGNGASFDGGSNAFVDVPSGVTELGDADFTIAAWIKTGMNGAAILAKSDNVFSEWEQAEKQFYVSNSGSGSEGPVGSVDMVGWGTDWISGDTLVNDDNWHHVAVTWNRAGTEGHMYVDGIEGTNYVGYNGRADNAGDLVRIGFDTSGEAAGNFSGLMDQVYVYDRVLTPEEITGMFGTATPPAMGNTDVLVTADSAIDVNTLSEIAFGNLTITGGSLSTTGRGKVSFAGITIDPAATDVGFDPQVATDYGVIDANNAPVTISKTGPSTWALETAPINLNPESSRWQVLEGTLQLAGETPLGGRPVTLAGGTLRISSATGGEVSELIGALVHYNFDETAGSIAVNSANPGTFDGTVGGATWTNDPQRGQVLNFDGDLDYVAIPALDPGAYWEQLSYAFWMNFNGPSDNLDVIIDTDIWQAGSVHYAVNGNGQPRFSVNGGDDDRLASLGFNSAIGEWHHVVTTYDANGQIVFYIDGEQDNVFPAINARTSEMGPRAIGSWNNGGTGNWERSINARFDDFMIFDRVLTAEEVAGMHGLVAPDMAGTELTVAADSTLDLAPPNDMVLGPLTMQAGNLAVTGAATSVRFAETSAAAGATAVGFDTEVTTYPGPLTGDWGGATVSKLGAADLVLDAVNASPAAFDVQEGRLIGLPTAADNNPFGAATLQVNGGEIVLAGSTTDGAAAYDNSVIGSANGMVTAGSGGNGTTGVAVTLGSAANPVTLAGSKLELRSTDDYTLNVAGPLSGGDVTVTEGVVTLAGADVDDLTVSGGQLNASADMVVQTMSVIEGQANFGANVAQVQQKLVLGETQYRISDNHSFDTADATSEGANITLTVPGSTLTVGSSALPQGVVGFWQFNEGDGDTTANAAGGEDADIVGAEWVDDPDRGWALQFEAGYVDVPDAIDVLETVGDAITIALWIRGNDNQPNSDFAFWGSIGGARAVGSHIPWGNSRVYWDAGGAASCCNDRLDQEALPEDFMDEWNHWAFTKDINTGDQKIFLNGEEWASATGRTISLEGMDAFKIGSNDGGGQNNAGLIDDFMIFDVALDQDGIELLYGGGAGMGDSTPVWQPDTNLTVTEDATLRLLVDGEATLGDLTIEAGKTLAIVVDQEGTVRSGGASVDNLSGGDGATVDGLMLVRGNLAPGGDGIGTLKIVGEMELLAEEGEGEAMYVAQLGNGVNDLVDVTAEAWLAGTLNLQAIESVGAVGDHHMTIFSASGDESEIIEEFAVVPAVGDHLGSGVFMADPDGDGEGVSYPDPFTTVEIDVFQAAAGDANGDGEVNNSDLQAILGAGSFGNPGTWDWAQGDFNGDMAVNNGDLQLILATGFFGGGPYAAMAAEAGAVVVPEPAALLVLLSGGVALLLWRRSR